MHLSGVSTSCLLLLNCGAAGTHFRPPLAKPGSLNLPSVVPLKTYSERYLLSREKYREKVKKEPQPVLCCCLEQDSTFECLFSKHLHYQQNAKTK